MTEADRDNLADTLKQWLAIDSTSGREKAFLQHLQTLFEDHGWNVRRQPLSSDRWNLVVTDGHAPRLLFSTHVDTVPPTLPVKQSGDRIYGRGACDTKGGLLAMWHAARTLRNQGVTGIGFLLVVGEEVDHCGAIKARELDIEPSRIILCEPTQNRVVQAQKGMLRATLEARGVAGHSAFPDDGQSAIEALLDTIEALRGETWPDDDQLGPTTFNIGVLEGGVAANVFAPTAGAEVLFRAVSPVRPLLERIEELAGPDVEVTETVSNDPVTFDPPGDVEHCTVPFNTDATYLGELADIWLVGPGDIRLAHSDEESIGLDEISEGIQLYQDLAMRAINSDH